MTNTIGDEVITAPTTLPEKQLHNIVAPLLDMEQVGIDDNFFLFGGTSLMGTQVIERVTETFNIELPLRTLFECPTIRLLASEIERRILANLETLSDSEILRLLYQDQNT